VSFTVLAADPLLNWFPYKPLYRLKPLRMRWWAVYIRLFCKQVYTFMMPPL